MNIHEFQAKKILRQFGVAVPQGEVASNPEQALDITSRIGDGQLWVVKAQVHAGGRGKAGGVKLLKDKAAVVEYVKQLLGSRLVTYQTTAEGQPVNQVLIEEPCDIEKELYLGAVIDRSSQRIVFMASTEGGMEIEKVAEEQPEKIIQVAVDPTVGMQSYQCRQLFFGLHLAPALLRPFTQLVMNLYRMFVANDLSLLEINPLVVTKQQQLLCLDAKINIDDNAMFRQNHLKELWDSTQDDDRETRAKQWDLNYIALDGNIGCMVNGAGLAMATMDLIKLHGGDPANFLDVGGGATKERVTEAFKIILSDSNVRAILVNIFGGIVRCDLIADGIIAAVAEVGVKVPVVVRLQGNNADLGSEKLEKSGLNIMSAADFTEAARLVVKQVEKAVV